MPEPKPGTLFAAVAKLIRDARAITAELDKAVTLAAGPPRLRAEIQLELARRDINEALSRLNQASKDLDFDPDPPNPNPPRQEKPRWTL